MSIESLVLSWPLGVNTPMSLTVPGWLLIHPLLREAKLFLKQIIYVLYQNFQSLSR